MSGKSFTAALLVTCSAPLAAQDGAVGQQAFAQHCAACHGAAPGARSALGPNLHGVVGRKAGTAAGFRFSPALVANGATWSVKTLDAFLAAPQKAVPGTRIATAVPDARTRADIVAFLASRR